MLAYTIFHENNNTGLEPGNGIPIKKIFVKNNSIIIDDKTIEQYGVKTLPSSTVGSLMVKQFNMPLDIEASLNLPNKKVASNSPKPYVVIPGYIKAFKKKDQITGEITLRNKKKGYFARLSIPDFEQEIISSDINFKIDSKRYFMNNETLYDVYCKHKILEDNKLKSSLFEKIVIKFFDYIKEKNPEFPKIKTGFSLYILPSDDPITFASQEIKKQSLNKIDAFGNNIEYYPKKPTTGLFFCSYDDKAFTINCTEKDKFYETLGIGNISHKKLSLPNSKKMTISIFDWYFINLENSAKIFTKRNQGIYDQLYHNYLDLKKEYSLTDTLASLMVFCIKKTNAKLEVMLNENLTMVKMESLFGDVQLKDIPPFALELLIVKKGSKSIFRYYVMAIKSLLNEIPVNRYLLIKIFTSKIRDEIREWVKGKSDTTANYFFKRSEFCLKTLNSSYISDPTLKEEEDFAKSVGEITRQYISFRMTNNHDNNSLREILSKPKYDIQTLQYVIKQIGRGIHLLNIKSEKYKQILDRISDITPEIVDSDSRKDFSYHFYMGYFRGVKK